MVESMNFTTAAFDETVRAQDDFYTYVNGPWLKANPIPEDYSRWGSFEELFEKNSALLREIMESAAEEHPEPGSIKQKVGDFYVSAMDTKRIARAGATPLDPCLNAIRDLDSIEDLVRYLPSLHRHYMLPFFAVSASPDAKNSSHVAAHFYQGGLGLPDRDFYLLEDKAEIREQYKTHIANSLALLGYSSETAAVYAQQIVDFELKLAEHSLTRSERRDPERVYNNYTLEDLSELVPDFDFKAYFKALGCTLPKAVIVENPPFMTRLAEFWKETSLETLKIYMEWGVCRSLSSYLDDRFVLESFDFYGRKLNGQKEIKPRWKRMLSVVSGSIGEAVGELYVERCFSQEAKEKALAMVEQLKQATREELESLTWMSETTKLKAKEKLDAFGVKIGYPDQWIDYSSLSIDNSNLVDNVVRSRAFAFKRDVELIDKPVDKTRWEMTPQTVNAYFHPTRNEIVFPAAILQPPFFDPDADMAVNLGAIGAIIGHEMTHGYDDSGRKFAADGNLKNWWQEADKAEFDRRAQVIVTQYNHYECLGKSVNGTLTQGENIADLGGLRLAYKALSRMVGEDALHIKTEGFSKAQLFFLSWARIWRNNIRDEMLLNRLITDPHSPGHLRVNGPLLNMWEFISAFEVKPADQMFLPEEERVDIW